MFFSSASARQPASLLSREVAFGPEGCPTLHHNGRVAAALPSAFCLPAFSHLPACLSIHRGDCPPLFRGRSSSKVPPPKRRGGEIRPAACFYGILEVVGARQAWTQEKCLLKAKMPLQQCLRITTWRDSEKRVGSR